MFKFDLGAFVREQITGYEGVVVGRAQHLTGCNTYGLKSRKLKDGIPIDTQWFDENQLALKEESMSSKRFDTFDTGASDINPDGSKFKR